MKREKNPQMELLIGELKKSSIDNKVNIWKRIAEDLSRPSRQKRTVNIYKIDSNSKEGEIIIVPGKVLGTGELSKKITVAAHNFSESAYEKIKQNGDALTIPELVKKNPKGKDVRILG